MGVKGLSLQDEEDKRIQLFHIKMQTMKTKMDALFDPGSQVNLIVEGLARQLNLETHPHPHPYPLGWMNENTEMQVTH